MGSCRTHQVYKVPFTLNFSEPKNCTPSHLRLICRHESPSLTPTILQSLEDGGDRQPEDTILVIAKRSPKRCEANVACPWIDTASLSASANNAANVIYIKLKRNKPDVSVPDLDVDCTLQQVTSAISAEKLRSLMELSSALDTVPVSPISSPPPPPVAALRESCGETMEPDLMDSPSPIHRLINIPSLEEDLYSDQPNILPGM